MTHLEQRAAATLLLEGEPVVKCHYCRQPSTNDVRGTDGWELVSLRRSGVVVEVCPECLKDMARAPFTKT